MRAITLAALLSLASLAAGRPSVLVILADDLGWRDLGVTGSEFYQTPHLDRLFASGVHFENGYASCQVCSPTRASLLTGKAPPRHGITQWIGSAGGTEWKRNTPLLSGEYTHALPAGDVTLPEALRDAGYDTFFAGKWHLGGEGSLPTDHGFGVNKGGYHSGSPKGGYFSPYDNPQLEDGPPGELLPLRLARETADFIQAQDGKPFFAMLSFYVVHGPLQTTRQRWEANRLEALSRPRPANRFLFDRPLPVRVAQDHPVYAGMVEAMDDAVGVVLDALRASGIADDTIVVFTSDNGGVSTGDGRATSNLPLRGGKGRQWEGGCRVPLAISWPGQIDGGQIVTDPAITTDLYPTLLELCDQPLAPEQHADGVSLASAMRGGAVPERPLFWHYPHYSNQGAEPMSSVLQDGWKLIRYHEDGREELYHLPTDESEHHDLADGEGRRVAALGELLDEWLAETGALLPPSNPDFDPNAAARHLRKLRTHGMKREEESAAAFLRPDWRPNPTWWGSEPKDEGG